MGEALTSDAGSAEIFLNRIHASKRGKARPCLQRVIGPDQLVPETWLFDRLNLRFVAYVGLGCQRRRATETRARQSTR
jgi:hypothetical protein